MNVNLDDLKHLKQFECLVGEILDEHAKYYFSAGATSSSIPRDNELAFKKYRIQPQVFRDVSATNLSCEILGEKLPCPIGIAPTGFHFFAHDNGEKATALGGAKEECIYIMSSVSSTTMEDVAKSVKSLPSKAVIWMQLYIFKDRAVTLDLVKRAENCGFSAVVVTADGPVSGQWKTDLPEGFADRTKNKYFNLPKPCYTLQDSSVTFEDLIWLRQHTKLPIIVKGIMCGEDAIEAVRCGANSIYVSNHGGRQIHNVLPTIDALEEVVEAVKEWGTEVYFDGGINHGSDVFVAMALGAKAVFVGRHIIWGLAVAGEEGVKRVLNILKEEFLSTMKLAGVTSVKEIRKSMIKKIQ